MVATAIAQHQLDVQAGLQLLYGSARLVRRFPGRFPDEQVLELRQQLELGAMELWRCEQLLKRVPAANDEASAPALA